MLGRVVPTIPRHIRIIKLGCAHPRVYTDDDYVITVGNDAPKGDKGKKLGGERQNESRPNRVPRIAPRKSEKAVCHELALKSERAENQLASI